MPFSGTTYTRTKTFANGGNLIPSDLNGIQDDLGNEIGVIRGNITTINTKVWPATVTALPGSPVDGQEIFYVADSTLGIIWHLKYRSASTSIFKWEFVGGSDIFLNQGSIPDANPIGVWGAQAGAALISPALPAGNFDVFYGMRGAVNAASSSMRIAPAIGATDPLTTTMEARSESYAAGVRGEWSASASARLTTAVGNTINLRFRFTEGTDTVLSAYVRIRPVRIG